MKNDHITKALFVVLFLIVSFVGATQCGSKYNTTKFKDPVRDAEWVYGKEEAKK